MSILPSEHASSDLQLGRLIEHAMEKLCAGDSLDVEALVAKDAEQTQQLAQLLPVLELLADLSQAGGHVEGVLHTAHPDNRSHPLGGLLGDYQIVRELGRGGMGVVYEALQLSLNRRVALKILPFTGMLDQRQLQRFKNEAQAAAGLHHPHIVPVYSVGCEKAVHFYAMQYIEGQTLARVIDELKELQTSDSRRRDSRSVSQLTQALVSGGGGTGHKRSHVGDHDADSQRADDLKQRASVTTDQAQAHLSTHDAIRSQGFVRSVARLGIQAAEALECAHQSGVVHRDIKPSNLLLDLDGNLWISDFGLAQTRAGPDITMTGDILGTLRYMSPEQAVGNRRILDHHTDIYSLGVTLYETLSLHPPFESNDRHQLIHQIIDGDVRPLRRANPAIPRDLETIVLKAMAIEPETRYATAQELAHDLRRFVDDVPIQARRPTLRDRAAKWHRRHRWVVAAVAAMLVITTISFAVSTLLVARAAHRESQQARLASDQRDRARANVRLGLQALDEIYVDVAAQRLPQQAQLSADDRSLLHKALRFYEAFAEGNVAEPTARVEMAKAYRRVGDIQLKLGDINEAERAYRRSIGGFQQAAAQFPNSAEPTYGLAAAFNNLGTALFHKCVAARSLDERPATNGSGLISGDGSTRVAGGLAAPATDGTAEEAEQAYRRALKYAQSLCDQSSDVLAYREELARSHNNLAVLLVATDRSREAETAFIKSRDLWRQLAQASPDVTAYWHRLGTCLANLANAWMQEHRYDEAEHTLMQVLDIAQKLLAAAPQQSEHQELLADAQNNLAVLLLRTERVKDAESYFEQALVQWRILMVRFPRVPQYQEKLQRTYQNLTALLDKRPADEHTLRRALAVRKEMVDALPHVDQYRHDLAKNHLRLAALLSRQQRFPEAESSYRSAIAQWQTLLESSTEPRPYQMGLAQAYNNLGILCRATGRTTAAADAYRGALDAMQQLSAEIGAVPAFRESVAKTRYNLGLTLGTSKPRAAQEALRCARQTFDDLSRGDSEESQYQLNLAATVTALGNLLVAAGQRQDAEPLLREAVELRHQLAERFPDDAAHQNSLAWLLANCADLTLRDPDRAAELARRAVALDPARAPSWNTLGAALVRAGQYAAAIDVLQKSIALSSGGEGNDWFFLAMVHLQLGDKEEAHRCYNRATQWMEAHRPHDAEMNLLQGEVRSVLEQEIPQ